MSIVFSAIAPHSPLLIPPIGKKNLERLKATVAAFKRLEEDLYASKAETLFVISPHGPIQPNSFTMNLSPEFQADFEEFGDFATKFSRNGDIGLAYKIREKLEANTPLQLISEKRLDHGSAIPLFLLTEHLPQIKIIPVYYAGLDLEAHFNFGQLLRGEMLKHKERIGIVASGDLSHGLTKDSPAGYSAKGKKFDQKVIEYLQKGKIGDLLALDHDFIAEASECGLKSIVTLMGILNNLKHEPQMLSYEFPFGVGYLVMGFRL